MKKRKWLAGVFGIVLSISLLSAGCSGGQDSLEPSGGEQTESSTQESDNEGSSLKSFEAKTLDGGSFTQDDLAKKDVTVINFWSVLCGPCIAEMPDIADFSKSLPDNVQIITVCLDGAYDVNGAKNILNNAGFEGITLISGDGDFEEVCEKILYTPTTIIVDKDGNIADSLIIGSQKNLEETYLNAINSTLKAMGKTEISNEKD